MYADLIIAGFLSAVVLYITLPEMNPLQKKYYSENIAPTVEEIIKILPALFRANPIPFAAGFAVFEAFIKRKNNINYLVNMVIFHVLTTATAYYDRPLGIIGAILVHYYVNRHGKLTTLYYINAVLATILTGFLFNHL